MSEFNKEDSGILEAMAGTENGVLADIAKESVDIAKKVVQDDSGCFQYLDGMGRLHNVTDNRNRVLNSEEVDREFFDLDSLIRYANMHATEATAGFFNPDSRMVFVVLDGDKNGDDQHMGLCRKRLFYQFTVSEAYKRWKSRDKRSTDHLDFAEFFEDNIEYIVEPDASDLLTCIQQLEVQQNVTYSNRKNLHNGSVEFNYAVETDTKQDKGTIVLPEVVKIQVPYLERTFNGPEEAELELTMKIRFKLREGRLTLTYIIEDHQDQIDAILAEKLKVFLQETDSVFQTFIGPCP